MGQNGGKRPGAGRPKGSKNKIAAAVTVAKAQALKLAQVTAERTMLEIARVAFANRASVWKDGKLLPFDEWPADALALLEGFEVVIKNAAAGDGHTDTVHKVHLAKKLGALEILAKHFNITGADVQVNVAITESLLEKLDRIKARNRTKGSE